MNWRKGIFKPYLIVKKEQDKYTLKGKKPGNSMIPAVFNRKEPGKEDYKYRSRCQNINGHDFAGCLSTDGSLTDLI